jgi:FAD/FMN-containing dehydrogenase
VRRKWEVTSDNLTGATLVTAAGAVIHVDEVSDPELLRGRRLDPHNVFRRNANVEL